MNLVSLVGGGSSGLALLTGCKFGKISVVVSLPIADC